MNGASNQTVNDSPVRSNLGHGEATRLRLDTGGQPKTFDPHGDAATCGERWKKFVRSFNFYAEGRGITKQYQKYSLFLSCAGEEVQDIFETLSTEISPTTADPYTVCVTALNEHFIPKGNKTFERHLFRQITQSAQENTDQFCTRLRSKIKLCGFNAGTTDTMLRDQLIQGVASVAIRRKFLEKGDDASLDDLLEIARVHELAMQQASHMSSGTKDSAVVNKVHHQKGKGSSHGKQGQFKQYEPRPSKIQLCFRCGKPGHFAADKACPAKSATCSSCKKVGHYAKMCKSRNNKSDFRPRYPIHVVQDEQENCETNDDGYIFGVNENDKAEKISVIVGGVKVDMLIDSGASVNIIGKDVWECMKMKCVSCVQKKTNKNIFSYGSNKPLPLLGKFDALVHLDDVDKNDAINSEFYVTEMKGPALMSKELAIKLGVLRLGKVHFLGQKEQIMQDYPTLFEGVGKLKNFSLKLKINHDVPPKAQKMYRIPFSLRDKVEKKLIELEEMDIIEKVDSPSEWVSPMIVVPKPGSNDIRLVVDMRAANEAVVRERHPIPTVDEVLHKMNGATVYSKLDLKYGYHQIELDPESRAITTFVTHTGLYRYKRLIFGINAAAEKYQHIISQVLHGVEGALNISDDITVFGVTQKEHDERLKQVIERLCEANLTLNKEKCQIGMDQITFMGHILSAHGIGPTEERVKDLVNAPRPTNISEVKSFLGLVNFSGRFIENLATKAYPLRKLTKKGATFDWGPEQEKSFEYLKRSLTSDATLGHFSLEADKTELITDASNVGICGILTQHKNGTHKVISYASRALTDAEKRYSTTEKEALAAVWACEKFHIYLYAINFELTVDHKALEFIFSPKSRPSARVERWAMRLMPYTFTVKYIPGHMNVADALSRLIPTPTYNHPKSDKTDDYVKFVATEATPAAMTVQEVEHASKDDPELQEVRRQLKLHKWDTSCKLYFPMREELCNIGYIVLRGTRIIIPKILRQKCIQLAHQGHLGIVATEQRLRTKVWWPGIYKQVENYIKTCHSCQLVGRPEAPEPLQATELPSSPWQDIGIDYLGPLDSGHYILVVIDYYSRFYEIEMSKKTTSEKVIETLERMFAMHGFPRTLRSDNAANFTSQEFETFLKDNGIEHRRSTPLHPAANGEVERQNRSLMKRIKIAKAENKNWKSEVRKYLFAYRTTPHSTTGKTPAEMLFGRKLRTKLPEMEEKNLLDEEERDHDKIRKSYYKTYADQKRGAKYSELEVGEKVLVKQKIQNKMDTPFHPDPFTLISKHGNSCVIESDEGVRYKRNNTHLKKFHTSDNVNDENESEQMTQNTENVTDSLNESVATSPSPPLYTTPKQHSPIIDLSESTSNELKDLSVRVSERPQRIKKIPNKYEDFSLY